MNVKNMMLVGATARNIGKTTFCAEFIKKWRDKYDITGLKVTVVRGGGGACHRGGEGCGVCNSNIDKYEIIEETNLRGSKDTQQLLAAGAKNVFWIKAKKEYVKEAFDTLYAKIPKENVIACESNSLAEYVNPGVKLLVRNNEKGDIKPSAAALLDKADIVVNTSIPGSIRRVLSKIDVSASGEGALVAFSGIFRGFTLIILAGGKSRRMGKDKAELVINGTTFLESMVLKGREQGFSEIIISGALKEIPGTKNVSDEIYDRGPLGGLYACLKRAENPYCLVVAVDIPRLELDALIPMAELHISSGLRATLLVSQGRLSPLTAVYNADLSADIYELIKDKPRKVTDLFNNIAYGRFDFKGDCRMLDNINTIEDYNSLRHN